VQLVVDERMTHPYTLVCLSETLFLVRIDFLG